ncbi:hypothetical protein GOODEAATRI_029394 [Goodea atripinnis]|uniref:Uncharacterized protein n=1 Tax=Goodea atripinnis TaxID=208336 RepID=A0ABV0N569_9TELE
MHKKLARKGEGGGEERDGEVRRGGKRGVEYLFNPHKASSSSPDWFQSGCGTPVPFCSHLHPQRSSPHPELRGRFLPKMASAAAKTQTAFFKFAGKFSCCSQPNLSSPDFTFSIGCSL